jgi:DNA-binding CsgD family transcriptional regulator
MPRGTKTTVIGVRVPPTLLAWLDAHGARWRQRNRSATLLMVLEDAAAAIDYGITDNNINSNDAPPIIAVAGNSGNNDDTINNDDAASPLPPKSAPEPVQQESTQEPEPVTTWMQADPKPKPARRPRPGSVQANGADIVRLKAEGRTGKQIGAELNVSPATVARALKAAKTPATTP